MKASISIALIGIVATSFATLYHGVGGGEKADSRQEVVTTRNQPEHRPKHPTPLLPNVEMVRELSKVPVSQWQDAEARAEIVSLLLRWAARSPADCVIWVRTLPEDIREPVLMEISGSLTAAAPEQALIFANEMVPGPVCDEMIRQLAMEFATRQPDEALAWAHQQTDPTTRDLLLSAVFNVQSGTSPRFAAEGALLIEDRALRDRTLVEISQRWAQQNPTEAAAFVTTLDGPLIVPAAVQLTSLWPPSDAESCLKWIASLPTADGRKEVLTALLHQSGIHDRQMLDKLMATTTDPAMAEVIRMELLTL